MLSPQKIIELAEQDTLSKSFNAFIRKCFHQINPTNQYIHNWHIDCLSEYLMALYNQEIKKLIINIPPRTSKSTICSQAFPAYALGKNPGLYFIFVSNSDSLAIEHSVKTRQIMESGWYKKTFPKTLIAKDQNQKTKFDTTMNGTRQATTSKTGVAGKGAHFIVFDDFLNSELAKSDKEREDLLDGFGSNFLTRLSDRREDGINGILVVEQRLHDTDLTGKLIAENQGYTHLCLPAYFESPKVISFGNFHKEIKEENLDEDGRYYLDKERFGKNALADLAASVKDFSGQYLQDPVLKGGNLVKLDWLNRYAYEELAIKKFNTIVVSCDTAYKPKQTNDPSCFIAFGIDDKDNYYVLDVLNKRMNYPTLKKQLLSFLELHNPNRILIEDKSSGQSLIQELAGTKYVPTKIEPKDYGGDKGIRFHNCTDVIEAGKLFVPYKASWLTEFESQLTRFPKAPHDDICDALSQFLNWAKGRKKQLLFFSF